VEVYVSLWSADLLDLGAAIDRIAPVADGIHLDVFDGHNVDDLLFGPDLVAAVRARTDLLLDVHLNVTDPDHWARRFLAAGADMVTVQSGACRDVEATLGLVRAEGGRPSLGIEVGEPLDGPAALAGLVDRFLVMGTPIGVKGLGLDPDAPARVSALAERLASAGTVRPVFVDGGIRAETVGPLAEAGADGVIPGSLVFGAEDPVAAVEQLHQLRRSA
jgi:ribulose-phosphate 3-epimerase